MQGGTIEKARFER